MRIARRAGLPPAQKPIMKKVKIFVVAGEVSGDVLGGEIMRAAPRNFEFSGIGGESMKAAGLKTLFPISDLSVMGFVEVLRKSRTLLRRIKQTADAIIRLRPDVVLTIDSPSFATRVIRRVRHAGTKAKFYHVVAPMVWAWGARRAKKYAEIFDRLFCFFDFEVPYFTKYGLDTVAIGYPIYDLVRSRIGVKKAPRNSRNDIIALLPGSRMGEVPKMLPVFKKLADCCPEYDFAIPTTETTHDFISGEIKSWTVRPKLVSFADRYELYKKTKLAIATSGTATAELAIMWIPAIVVYKANWLTTLLANIVLKVKHIGLVNILAKKEIYPELRGRRVSAQNIMRAIKNMDVRKMISELKSADKLWHKKKSPMKIVIDEIADFARPAE